MDLFSLESNKTEAFEKIQNLRKELTEHNYKYYVLDNPSISDYDFDMKIKELQSLERQFPEFYDAQSPSVRVGGEVIKNFQTIWPIMARAKNSSA